MFRQKLRDLPILGSVYAIIAALGLVVLAVGVIGVAAVYTTNKHVRELEEVANRAFFAEHANALHLCRGDGFARHLHVGELRRPGHLRRQRP